MTLVEKAMTIARLAAEIDPVPVRTLATRLWEGALTLFVVLMLGMTFGMYFR